jgi:hypothetical protein
MIASSYAHAATGATATSAVVGHGIPSSHHDGPSTFSTLSLSSLMEQIRELSTPAPTSMTLTAALQLLEPLDINRDVFLMTRSYLHNWLIWAYHQKVSKLEASRVQAAVRLAATRLGLTPPRMDMEYTDPGPIDCTLLSLEGHPLLLRPNVEVVDIDSERKKQQEGWMKIPESLRRVKSLPTAPPNNEAEEATTPMDEDLDEKDGHVLCSAAPARFYEVRRITKQIWQCNTLPILLFR